MKKLFIFLFMLVGLSAIAQTNTTYIRSRVIDSTTVNTPSGYGSIYYNEKAGKWQYVENGVKHNLTNPNLTTRQELIDSLLALEGRMVDSLEVHRLLLIDSISAVRETIDANYILVSDSLAELRNDITDIENNYATIEQLSDSIGALEGRMVDSLEVHRLLLIDSISAVRETIDANYILVSDSLVELRSDITALEGRMVDSLEVHRLLLIDSISAVRETIDANYILVSDSLVKLRNDITYIENNYATIDSLLALEDRMVDSLEVHKLLLIDSISAVRETIDANYILVSDSLVELRNDIVSLEGRMVDSLAFLWGGNAFGDDSILGLTDDFNLTVQTGNADLTLRTNGTDRIVISADGRFRIVPLMDDPITQQDGDIWIQQNGAIKYKRTGTIVDIPTLATGTAASARVAYFADANTITGNNDFRWSNTNKVLQVFGHININEGTRAGLKLASLSADPTTSLEDGQLWYNSTQNAFKGRVNNEYAFMLHTTQGGVMNRLAFFTGQAEITTDADLEFDSSTNQLQVPALQVNNINSGSSDDITLSAVSDVVFDPIPLQDDTLKRIAAFDQDGKLRWRDASTLEGFTNSAAANELMMSDGTNAIGSGIIRIADGQFLFGSGSAFLDAGGANGSISLRARGHGSVTISTSEAISETNAHISLRPGTGAVSDQRGAVIIQKRVISNGIVRPLRLFSDAAEGFTPGPGDGLGIEYRFDTNGAGNEEIAATIDVVSTDMTSGSEDFDMIFRTTSAGVGPTEKFRITSAGNMQLQGGLSTAGNLGIGTTAPSYDFHLIRNTSSNVVAQLENDGSGQVEISLVRNGGTASSWSIYLKPEDSNLTFWSGSDLFTFSTAGVGTAVNWASTSDIRLKNNIKYASPQLEKVMRIANVVRNYDRTDTGENETGFIAQELVEIAPEYVNEGNDSTMWSVNYSKMVVPLYKAMAELQAEIEALKDELNKHKQCEH